jgi:hypothetical protein
VISDVFGAQDPAARGALYAAAFRAGPASGARPQ